MSEQDHQEERDAAGPDKGPAMVIVHEAGRTGIRCVDCQLTSWNLNDVAHTYCGNCHRVGHVATR